MVSPYLCDRMSGLDFQFVLGLHKVNEGKFVHIQWRVVSLGPVIYSIVLSYHIFDGFVCFIDILSSTEPTMHSPVSLPLEMQMRGAFYSV